MTKQLKCRDHGGIFTVPSSRGRYPVRCNEDNICDQHPEYVVYNKSANRVNRRNNKRSIEEIAKRTSRTLRGEMPRKSVQNRRRRPELVEEAPTPRKTRKPRQKEAQPVVVRHNPSIPLAFEARRLLEPNGWAVKGRAGDDAIEDLDLNKPGGWAMVNATRGNETITLTWVAGKLVKQDYSMFPSDIPTLPGMPRKRLPFEPSDIDDAGLIRAISGKKVIWWNVMGQRRETAIMPHRADSKLKIEHMINGHGEEQARIVTFVDQDGTGYRSFNVNALVNVQ